jgi:quinol-cytochrome oxidoreductase complex cytochrome b subunit
MQTRPPTTDAPNGGRRVVRWLVGAALAQMVFLAVSGAFLLFEYRPAGAGDGPSLDARIRVAAVVRDLHLMGSWLLGATLVAVIVGAALERWPRRRVPIAAGAMLIVALLTSFTGNLLRWDQLALRTVTADTDMAGFRPLMSDQVLFVFVGDAEVDTSTVLAWLAVHLVLGLALVAGGIVLAAWTRAGSRPSAGPVR